MFVWHTKTCISALLCIISYIVTIAQAWVSSESFCPPGEYKFEKVRVVGDMNIFRFTLPERPALFLSAHTTVRMRAFASLHPDSNANDYPVEDYGGVTLALVQVPPKLTTHLAFREMVDAYAYRYQVPYRTASHGEVFLPVAEDEDMDPELARLGKQGWRTYPYGAIFANDMTSLASVQIPLVSAKKAQQMEANYKHRRTSSSSPHSDDNNVNDNTAKSGTNFSSSTWKYGDLYVEEYYDDDDSGRYQHWSVEASAKILPQQQGIYQVWLLSSKLLPLCFRTEIEFIGGAESTVTPNTKSTSDSSFEEEAGYNNIPSYLSHAHYVVITLGLLYLTLLFGYIFALDFVKSITHYGNVARCAMAAVVMALMELVCLYYFLQLLDTRSTSRFTTVIFTLAGVFHCLRDILFCLATYALMGGYRVTDANLNVASTRRLIKHGAALVCVSTLVIGDYTDVTNGNMVRSVFQLFLFIIPLMQLMKARRDNDIKLASAQFTAATSYRYHISKTLNTILMVPFAMTLSYMPLAITILRINGMNTSMDALVQGGLEFIAHAFLIFALNPYTPPFIFTHVIKLNDYNNEPRNDQQPQPNPNEPQNNNNNNQNENNEGDSPTITNDQAQDVPQQQQQQQPQELPEAQNNDNNNNNNNDNEDQHVVARDDRYRRILTVTRQPSDPILYTGLSKLAIRALLGKE